MNALYGSNIVLLMVHQDQGQQVDILSLNGCHRL